MSAPNVRTTFCPELVKGLPFPLAQAERRKSKASTSSARTVLGLTLVLALSACKPAEVPKQDLAKGGPPPIPPYQMRAELPSGDRLASGKDGSVLFSNRCGSCHLAGGMGSNLLTKQMLAAKRPPSDGLLENRTDLTQSYVMSVVRQGKMAMPRLSRIEVTDAELSAIAKHLGKAGE